MSRLCHSLSDESTRAATVFGSWIGIEGLVCENDLVENIRVKSQRGPKSTRIEIIESSDDSVDNDTDIVENISDLE